MSSSAIDQIVHIASQGHSLSASGRGEAPTAARFDEVFQLTNTEARPREAKQDYGEAAPLEDERKPEKQETQPQESATDEQQSEEVEASEAADDDSSTELENFIIAVSPEAEGEDIPAEDDADTEEEALQKKSTSTAAKEKAPQEDLATRTPTRAKPSAEVADEEAPLSETAEIAAEQQAKTATAETEEPATEDASLVQSENNAAKKPNKESDVPHSKSAAAEQDKLPPVASQAVATEEPATEEPATEDSDPPEAREEKGLRKKQPRAAPKQSLDVPEELLEQAETSKETRPVENVSLRVDAGVGREASTSESFSSTSTTTTTSGEQRVASTPASLPNGEEASEPTIDRGRFLQRVSGAIRTAQERDGQIQLRLSPPELGTLKVEISVKQGVLSATLETDNSAARNLLLDNLPALRERLAEQDIRVEKFDVDVRRDGTGQQQEEPGPQDRRSPSQARNSSNSQRREPTLQETEIIRTRPSLSTDQTLDVEI